MFACFVSFCFILQLSFSTALCKSLMCVYHVNKRLLTTTYLTRAPLELLLPRDDAIQIVVIIINVLYLLM